MKDYLTRHEARVVELIEKGDDSAGKQASALWSQAFDGLLSSLFCAVRHQFDDEELFDSVALGAVGSYGRDNFALKSDLDVRILCPKPERVVKIAEALLYPLWDAGVQIGHQVVTQADMLNLAKTDLPTATTLLDWRHLMGNQDVSSQLKKKAFDSVFSKSQIGQFLEELHIQSELRWGRFGDSVYLLEPDLKNGRGGVRDLDILSWIAQARFRVPDLAGLVKIGVLLEPEFEDIRAASQFLQRVRNILHFGSRRRTDRLGFEGQEQVAELMGYGTGGAGCELMMSEYYRHARTVSNSLETLFYRARPTERRRKKVTELALGIEQIGDEVALARIDDL
jgi:[protein-PII] uridylyltransferase